MGSTPPSWFEDPEEPGRLRWWDGQGWTRHVAEVPAPAAAPPRERMWRSQWALVVVIALSAVAAITGIVLLVSGSISAVTATPVPTPAVIEQQLEPGTYMVYAESGSKRTAGPVTFSESSFPPVAPEHVTVTGAGGPLEVTGPGASYTVQQGSILYLGVAQFTVVEGGEYSIDVAGESSRVLVAPRLLDGAAPALVLFLVAGFVGAASTVGLVGIVLVKASRRRRY